MTNVALDPRIRSLSPEQRRKLAERLRQSAPAPAETRIPRRPPGSNGVLSFGQQRLWFLEQLQPGTAAYNVPGAVHLLGPLDADALARALEDIVRRHEVLRTTFTVVNGQPSQVISATWPAVMKRMDLTSRPAAVRRTEAEAIVEQEARRPFDLASDLMLRALLITLGAEEHLLLFVSHHVAWDPGSRGVFHAELERLYAHFTGDTAELPGDLPIQYADFAAWQRATLAGEHLQRLEAYWGRQLEGAPPRLDQPIDRRRPAVATHDGRKHLFVLPQTLIDSASRTSIRAKGTLFMTLLAVFNVFLAGRANQFDLVLGSPIAGRGQSELELLIGFFINTLALRTRLARTQTFNEVLATVREMALGAYGHQEMPFDKIVELVHPPRDRSRNPVFQVNFRLSQTAARPLALKGLSVTPLDLVDTGTSKFDLALDLSVAPGGVSYFEYSTDLFDDETAARMERDFIELATALLESPDVPLESLPAFQAVGRQPMQEGRRVITSRRERVPLS